MQFLRTNMEGLAGMAVSMGGSLSKAVEKLKGEQTVTTTPPPPPPPPPPDGARIRRAEAKAMPAPKPPGSMPGSSNDPPSIFGGPAPPGHKKKKSELEIVDGMVSRMTPAGPPAPKPGKPPTKKPTTISPPKVTLAKLKNKKDTPVGVKKESTVPDPTTKLTTHGVKPVIHTKKDEDKPEPHVPPASEVKYPSRKRKGDHKPPVTGVKRAIPQRTQSAAKRTRRVSAHEI
jgi:hypothetical protein